MQKTYHKADCKRVFNRYDSTCPRCQELINGAPSRKGWNMSYNYQMKHGIGPEYEKFKKALRSHDCKKSNCGPVCTAFDY